MASSFQLVFIVKLGELFLFKYNFRMFTDCLTLLLKFNQSVLLE
jgi:hypothetical protein